jgi:hypothetical protein
MDVFSNYTINKSFTSFNGNNFSWTIGFAMMIDFNITYYITDNIGNMIYLLNDNYDYITQKSFSQPSFIVTINSNLFITGERNIWKTDEYLNVLLTHSESGSYRGIYYNCTENLIYVAPLKYDYFQVFNINLTLNHNVSVSPKHAYSFSGYKSELYVGTTDSNILVIAKKTIIRNFTVCSSTVYVTSIVTDYSDLMAISCKDNYLVNLYYSNGTFTGKNLTTPYYPYYVGFDSKGYFVSVSIRKIDLYF